MFAKLLSTLVPFTMLQLIKEQCLELIEELRQDGSLAKRLSNRPSKDCQSLQESTKRLHVCRFGPGWGRAWDGVHSVSVANSEHLCDDTQSGSWTNTNDGLKRKTKSATTATCKKMDAICVRCPLLHVLLL